MSLVNSMINQIGREIGKDVYKGLKNNLKPLTDVNSSFLNEASNFKLAAYDKVTIKNLINLIAKSDNIESRSFGNWEDCYVELDNKIDFCKEHLDKEHLDKLEELDKINNVNYAVAKSQHKTFVSKRIDSIQEEIKKHEESNILIPILLSLFGLNAFYYKSGWGVWHILSILASGFLIYNGLSRPKVNSIEPSHVAISGFIIYGLVLLASFIRIGKDKNRIKKLKEDTVPSLIEYLKSMK